jgi:hypothetical protein
MELRIRGIMRPPVVRLTAGQPGDEVLPGAAAVVDEYSQSRLILRDVCALGNSAGCAFIGTIAMVNVLTLKGVPWETAAVRRIKTRTNVSSRRNAIRSSRSGSTRQSHR